MDYKINSAIETYTSDELVLLAAYSKTETTGSGKKEKKTTKLVPSNWSKEIKSTFESLKSSENFNGAAGTNFTLNDDEGRSYFIIGLGEKNKVTAESLRKELAKNIKSFLSNTKSLSIDLDSFKLKSDLDKTVYLIGESLSLATYKFSRHLSKNKENTLKTIHLDTKEKKSKLKKTQSSLDKALTVSECVNYARDLVNEPPNILNSENYAKKVEADAKKIKGVKCKILGKKELKKEKANLFLSVNAGSAFEPQLVHLTYTPSKVTSKTKHIALVGKGLTFDTGGYSLKPSTSMINMKFDMAGSATVYAAFRAAAMTGANVKVTCILGMTDNAVNSLATMPDSIVKGRNGKTVEILNTDAEGRLVLADCLDYACDQKPDAIIDAATLTGACLYALGSEVCGVMGSNQKLVDKLLKSAKDCDEYMWQLPIINEWADDMKGTISDLKNIGGSGFAGTAKAAAFLREFVKNDIPWAHLDIAGIGDGQGSHLPYCPAKGGSGLVVRTLLGLLENAK